MIYIVYRERDALIWLYTHCDVSCTASNLFHAIKIELKKRNIKGKTKLATTATKWFIHTTVWKKCVRVAFYSHMLQKFVCCTCKCMRLNVYSSIKIPIYQYNAVCFLFERLHAMHIVMIYEPKRCQHSKTLWVGSGHYTQRSKTVYITRTDT